VSAHDKDINTVAVSPNGAIICTGSQDRTAKLWRTTDLAPVATLKGHKRGVWQAMFSPVDKVVATGSADRTVKVWRTSTLTLSRARYSFICVLLDSS
jgi:U3 small nucleolar RNA-associated protein 13